MNDKDKEELKVLLSDTLKQIEKTYKRLVGTDSVIVQDALNDASKAIRPMLYLLRTTEENQKQQEVDRYL